MEKKLIQRIGFALVMALFVVIVFKAIGPKHSVKADDIEATKPVLAENWKLRQIGTSGMSVLVPDSLKQIPVVLDDNAKQTLEAYDAFEYNLASFGLRLNHIKAKYELKTEDYAKELAGMIRSSDGVSTYSYEVSPYTKGAESGSLLKGTAKKGGLDIEIDSVIISRGVDLWEVTVSFNSGNKPLRTLSEQVLNSLGIE